VVASANPRTTDNGVCDGSRVYPEKYWNNNGLAVRELNLHPVVLKQFLKHWLKEL
jgi:hypothetical protein